MQSPSEPAVQHTHTHTLHNRDILGSLIAGDFNHIPLSLLCFLLFSIRRPTHAKMPEKASWSAFWQIHLPDNSWEYTIVWFSSTIWGLQDETSDSSLCLSLRVQGPGELQGLLQSFGYFLLCFFPLFMSEFDITQLCVWIYSRWTG